MRVYFDYSETRRIARHGWRIGNVAAAVGSAAGAAIGGWIGAGVGAPIVGAYSGWVLDVAANAYSDGRRLYLTYDWRPLWHGGARLYPGEC
jgi:hypothetical protein